MSEADYAAAVAEDYRHALEDLTMNSRVEIATLTNVANESINYAHAISEVLQKHIEKTPANKTLPALYVLDSIVKNVGTPYTLYFGRNLFTIFMRAYAKVDGTTRRKMDEMLKTWKEPVPGSLDKRPVFPAETTRPIDNALLGARTAALGATHRQTQGQQQFLARGRMPMAPPRETPTPPEGRHLSYQHVQQAQHPVPAPQVPPHVLNGTPIPTDRAHNNSSNGVLHSNAPYQQSMPPAPSAMHPPLFSSAEPNPPSDMNMEQLKEDVRQLIAAERAEFAQNPLDTSKQTKLRALLDLQTIIQNSGLPLDHLELIRKQVDELSVNMRVNNAQRQPPVPALAAAGSAHAYHATPPPPLPPSSTSALALALAQAQAQAQARARARASNTTSMPVPPSGLGATRSPTVPAPVSAPLAGLVLPMAANMTSRPPAQVVPPAPMPTPSSLGSLLRSSALASLLAQKRCFASPRPVTTATATALATPPAGSIPPVINSSIPSVINSSIPPVINSIPNNSGRTKADPMALMAMLKQSGMLGPAAKSKMPTVVPTPSMLNATPQANLANLSNLASLIAKVKGKGDRPLQPPGVVPQPVIGPEPQLTVESLKHYRPNIVERAYSGLGAPCTQCGRRFAAHDLGRKKKMSHMDWHYRVNQRMAEAERRGQHRDWNVNVEEWVRMRESLDGGDLGSVDQQYMRGQQDNLSRSKQPGRGWASQQQDDGNFVDGSARGQGPKKQQFILAPDPNNTTTNRVCPLCQEEFSSEYMKDGVDDWVWVDTMWDRELNRVFHASCRAAAPVLGKRKADEDPGSEGRKWRPYAVA